MMQAVAGTDQAAEALSFIHAVRILRRRLQAAPPVLFPPEQRKTWLESVLKEIAVGRAVTTRGRRNPPGVKRKMNLKPVWPPLMILESIGGQALSSNE